jgi:hypothetical protein
MTSKTIVSLIVVLVLLCQTAFAISEGEKSALREILKAFPGLALISPYNPSGGPWYDNFDNLCGSGYQPNTFYSLTCSSDGHIEAISLYVTNAR